MSDDETRPPPLTLDDLSPELAQRVASELDRDERLVWVGQPRPDLYAKSSGCLIVFGVFFTVFALVWMAIPLAISLFAAGVGGEGGGFIALPFVCFSLFGIPFVLVGLGLMTSPIWMKKLARRCCYALTDRRALLWEPRLFGGATVRSFTRAGLGRIARLENADGSGSLVFHEYVVHGSESSTTHQQGFMHIDDVQAVERLVRKTLVDDEDGR